MRSNVVVPVVCLIVGVAVGVGVGIAVGRELAKPEEPPAVDPDLLARFGDPSLSGIAIGYRTTDGTRYDIQYMAPPLAESRDPYPHVLVTNENQLRIEDGVRSLVIDFAAGTVMQNDVAYVSSRPERELSLIRPGVGSNIYLLGDGRIEVDGFRYVAQTAPEAEDTE